MLSAFTPSANVVITVSYFNLWDCFEQNQTRQEEHFQAGVANNTAVRIGHCSHFSDSDSNSSWNLLFSWLLHYSQILYKRQGEHRPHAYFTEEKHYLKEIFLFEWVIQPVSGRGKLETSFSTYSPMKEHFSVFVPKFIVYNVSLYRHLSGGKKFHISERRVYGL